MSRDVGGDDPRAGNLHPAAFEKELAPVAIAELDPIRVGADGVIAGSQGLPDFEVNLGTSEATTSPPAAQV